MAREPARQTHAVARIVALANSPHPAWTALGFEEARPALRKPVGAIRALATSRGRQGVSVDDLLPPLAPAP